MSAHIIGEGNETDFLLLYGARCVCASCRADLLLLWPGNLGGRQAQATSHVVPCSEFSVDRARKLFEGGCGESATLRLRPLEGRGWQVLILEELEWVSPQCQAYLKVVLETKLPSKCIVVGTSNGAGKLSSALLQRFRIYRYGSGQLFATCAQQRLEAIWQAECPGAQLPAGWETWGWTDGEFSMRVALDAMQDQLTLLELAA